MFVPIKDDAPTIRKPYLTVTLIVVNSLVFLDALAMSLEHELETSLEKIKVLFFAYLQ